MKRKIGIGLLSNAMVADDACLTLLFSMQLEGRDAWWSPRCGGEPLLFFGSVERREGIPL